MAITNPLAIKFSNEDVRPLAERFARLYYSCKSFLDFWGTNNGDAVFPVSGGPVEDNSVVDGRTPINSDDVRALKAWAETYVSGLEANSDEKLAVVIKPSVRVKLAAPSPE